MSYPEALSELTNYPKALSHASGGSGGDFSIAKVTFQNSTEMPATVTVANVQNNATNGNYSVLSEGTADVILANGSAAAWPNAGLGTTLYLNVVSGAAVSDGNVGAVISGDCVIEITSEDPK